MRNKKRLIVLFLMCIVPAPTNAAVMFHGLLG